jgi:hypothetical protein
VRARQFDGIDRYSGWTEAVRFRTDKLPDKPTLVAPVGEVPADGQSFIWNAASQTDTYRLLIRDASNRVLNKVNLTPAQAGCSSICTVPLASRPVAWQPGTLYRWQVVAINEEGRVKSTKSAFTLVASP